MGMEIVMCCEKGVGPVAGSFAGFLNDACACGTVQSASSRPQATVGRCARSSTCPLRVAARREAGSAPIVSHGRHKSAGDRCAHVVECACWSRPRESLPGRLGDLRAISPRVPHGCDSLSPIPSTCRERTAVTQAADEPTRRG